MYYDKQGNKITVDEMIQLVRDDPNYKRIELDVVGPWRVSTVWLGLDHGWHSDFPVIFETMVFEGDSWRELFCKRYSLLDEAVEGHQLVVKCLKAGKLPDEIDF